MAKGPSEMVKRKQVRGHAKLPFEYTLKSREFAKMIRPSHLSPQRESIGIQSVDVSINTEDKIIDL